MKKRNLVATVASVALVGVIGIGSTLAYLSANDGTLTNKFEFANNIVVDVYETRGEETVGVGATDGGFNYTNLVPGQELEKDVDLDVNTTFETYLYVNVQPSDEGELLMDIGALNGWTKVDGVEGDYGVYRMNTTVSQETKGINIFDTVTVPETTDANKTIKDIVIDVWAAQASAFNSTTEADAAAIAYFAAQ